MTHETPGTPLVTTIAPITEVLAATPHFEDGDGFQLLLADHFLLITARMDGNEGELGIPIEALLEAIGKYNHRAES